MKTVQNLALLALVLGVSAESLSHHEIRAVQASAGASYTNGASAGVTLVTSALSGCKAKVDTCSSAVADLSAGADINVSVSAIADLVATLKAAVSTCKSAGSLAITDLVGLKADISALADACGSLSTGIVAKKDIVAELNGCSFVGGAILDIQASAGALFEAIIGLTADLHLGADIGGLFGIGAGVDVSALGGGDASVIVSLVGDLAAHLQVGVSTFSNDACVDAGGADASKTMGGGSHTATGAITGGATATAIVPADDSYPNTAKGASATSPMTSPGAGSSSYAAASPTGSSSGSGSSPASGARSDASSEDEPDYCSTTFATAMATASGYVAGGTGAPYPTTASASSATYTNTNGTSAKGSTPVQAGSSSLAVVTAMIGVVGFSIAMLI